MSLLINFLNKNKYLFISASSLFAFMAMISCILFPHGIFDISRIDHYMILFSAFSFILIGRQIFDLTLIVPYLLLTLAFSIPIFYHTNQFTYFALRELIPLLIGSYIISFHFKNNNFSRNLYYIFCLIVMIGIILCLIQNVTRINYWLINLYDIELIKEYLTLHIDNFEPGFGYSLEPESLGYSSLFFSLIIIGASIYKKITFITMIILLSLSSMGMLLSGWRTVWLAYFISILVMFFIKRNFYKDFIWSIIVFLFFHFLFSVIINFTNFFPSNSNLVRGAEGRFYVFKNISQTNKILNAQHDNFDARMWHWNYFPELLMNNHLLGSGPKSYPEKTTLSYVRKNHPYFTYEDKKKDYSKFFKLSSFDALSALIVIGVEYGLWALFFISCVFYLIILQLISIYKTKSTLSFSSLIAISIFFSVLIIINTRSYQYANFAWYSLAFLIGSLQLNNNKNVLNK